MFERIISAVAPGWALSRQRSRLAARRLADVVQRYEGAANNRRTRNWQASNASPNAETSADLATLRARSRDLVRNNPYAAAGLDMLVAYQVGTGIVPRSRTGDLEIDRAANALWAEWGRSADSAGRHDINGLMAQVARSRAEAGEVLCLLRPLAPQEADRRRSPVPLALHVLEVDHLDTASVRRLASPYDQGVEADAYGRPLAYHILPRHPGDWTAPAQSIRVPAEYCLHVFRQDRPGQFRGTPDLAPVMARLRLLDEAEDAVLMQMLVQACVAAFVTSSEAAGEGALEAAPDDTGTQVKKLRPGMIERLLPGEDVQFLNPSGGGNFPTFARNQLHAIATGFGLTYDLMTGDLSQATYSSLRAGRLAFKRRLESLQWLVLVPQFCAPVWDAFISAAQLAGQLPARPGRWPVEWAPPRFEMVDPLKDTLAIREQLRLGLVNWFQAVAEFGEDPQGQAREIAQANGLFDDLGLILDGDPRRTAASGMAQDARQNAAVEIAATGAALPSPPP